MRPDSPAQTVFFLETGKPQGETERGGGGVQYYIWLPRQHQITSDKHGKWHRHPEELHVIVQDQESVYGSVWFSVKNTPMVVQGVMSGHLNASLLPTLLLLWRLSGNNSLWAHGSIERTSSDTVESLWAVFRMWSLTRKKKLLLSKHTQFPLGCCSAQNPSHSTTQLLRRSPEEENNQQIEAVATLKTSLEDRSHLYFKDTQLKQLIL